MSLSELFRDPGLLWGLRGDPFMWEALEKRFLEVEMSSSTEELVRMIKTEYQAITGQPLENDDYAYVEEFAHGGMSSGLVCPKYWREAAIPLLVERYVKYKG